MALTTQIDSYKGSCRFSSVLSSAAHEWLLMLLLFINAIFSYLVTKFARYCNLQTPCLLCSRVDHILSREKPGFYWDLICESHKSEISLLANCRIHRKLANACEMCEHCLASFSMEKYNPEMYRLLVGKTEIDPDCTLDAYYLSNDSHGGDVAEVPLQRKDSDSNSLVTNHCSCCSVPIRDELHAVRLLQNKRVKVDSDENVISSSKPRGHKHQGHGTGKMLEKSLGSPLVNHSGNHGVDTLSRIGYSEVKVTSDSESEVPSSDDDNGVIVDHEVEEFKEDDTDRCLQSEPDTSIPNDFIIGHEVEDFKEDVTDRCLLPEPDTSIRNELSATLSDDTTLEKLINTSPITLESPHPIPEKQLFHIVMPHDVSSMASTMTTGHGLEEIKWSKVEVRNNHPAPCETIYETIVPEVPNVEDSLENFNVARFSRTSSEEVPKASSLTDVNLKMSQISGDPGPSAPIHMDLNDAYKLATSYKSNLPSPNVAEVITGRDSFRVYEDLKLLISQMSAARGLESPWNDLSPSPRVQGQGDDFKFSDASSSAVLHNITRRLSIERYESGLESLDGSLVSEIEGESVVDRLKRQLELDRKSLYLLYRELEEERSASGIAASQAMAMITRLQQEKAALQMEALQYQRLMEEQAEYDNEALQKSNELLTQRENYIQDIEAHLEGYKQRFGYESLEANSTPDNEFAVSNKFEVAYDPFLGFEDEKSYILDRLKELEKKLSFFSNDGVYADMPRLDIEEDGSLNKPREDVNGGNHQKMNGWYSSEVATRDTDLAKPHCNFVPHDDYHVGHGVLLEDFHLSRGDSNAKASPSLLTQASSENDHKESFLLTQASSENDHKESLISSTSNNDAQDSLADVKVSNFSALRLEVSHLNERLKALEADCNFLEHTINSLRYGDSGIQFIQEIACDLQELRRIDVTRREQTAA